VHERPAITPSPYRPRPGQRIGAKVGELVRAHVHAEAIEALRHV